MESLGFGFVFRVLDPDSGNEEFTVEMGGAQGFGDVGGVRAEEGVHVLVRFGDEGGQFGVQIGTRSTPAIFKALVTSSSEGTQVFFFGFKRTHSFSMPGPL